MIFKRGDCKYYCSNLRAYYMHKILILTEHYPSEDNIYNYMFIHSRVLEYIKCGCEVRVLYLSDVSCVYCYEGVEVNKGAFDEYKDKLLNFSPDVIFTHSPKKRIVSNIVEIKKTFKVKNYTWIHGVEALSIFRRIFNTSSMKERVSLFTIGIVQEIRRVLRFRKYAKICENSNDEFIFVSHWMKKITESDNYIKIEKANLIPNFIDYEGFESKRVTSTKNILIVRSFESRKYANDISIQMLNELNKLREDFTVTIYGEGRYFNSCIQQLNIGDSRVQATEKMLPREELKECLKDSKYSFFMCPTRQDAQGVTMCEAMASGLIVVTNNSTAIPEFVSPEYAIISDDVALSAEMISNLMNNKKEFLEKSNMALEYIRNNLSSEILITKELNLINKNDS